MNSPAYVGRFAPSPTGPLHFGSVVAAVGSWLDARNAGGRWLLRLDDLDRPRNEPEADRLILAELTRLGLEWDGDVHRQKSDETPYRSAIGGLSGRELVFPCGCSRKDLVNGIYPGTCRNGLPCGREERSLRLRVTDELLVVNDRVQGTFSQNLASDLGDFVVRRADGVIAYHLATVVDDAKIGVTHVVRGADLLDSTPRQMALQSALELPHPHYTHLPVVTTTSGQKLSKQNQAPSTVDTPPELLWLRTLTFLGQSPPDGLDQSPLKAIIDWAIDNWNLSRVPPTRSGLPEDHR